MVETYETKVVGNGSSYCSNFFYFDEIWKIKEVEGQKTCIFYIFCRIGQNQGWAITATFFRFHKKNGPFPTTFV